MYAGQNLDQRRFAGAIVAEQGMDLARPRGERDILKRHDRAELLADADQLDDGGGSGCLVSPITAPPSPGGAHNC